MTYLGAGALLYLIGWYPSRRLARRPFEVFLLAPIVTAVGFAVAGTALLLLAASPLVFALGAVVALQVVAFTYRPVRRHVWHSTAPRPYLAVVIIVYVVVMGLFLTRPPIDWDAHSIWLYHSDWFATGGSAARAAVSFEQFSHPDYPPLLPATAGLTSRLVTGALDWRLAQLVIAVVGWSALASVGALLIDRTPRRWLAAAGSLLLAAVSVQQIGVSVANAEADFGAAALLLLAAVALLVVPGPDVVGVGLLAATAAMLCKGEALVATAAVVAVGWFVAGRPRRWIWAVPMAAGAAWLLTARILGAVSFLADDETSAAPGRALARGARSAWALVEEVGTLGLAGVMLIVAAAAWSPTSRRRLRHLALVVAVIVAGLVAVYAIGPHELDWWLRSSVGRVALGPKLLIVLGALIAVDALLDVAGATTPTGRSQHPSLDASSGPADPPLRSTSADERPPRPSQQGAEGPGR